MDFAQSTFTLEVNQTPVLVFQAKWAAEAEDIGFEWAQDHLQQLSTKGSYGTNLPPIIKVRIARHDEKAAYEIQSNNSDLYAGVKIVYLIDLNSLS